MLHILDPETGERVVSFPTPISGGLPASLAPATYALAGLVNANATTDPGVSNDVTQGYVPGSIWVNNTGGALRWWECRSNAQGAASWVYGGADYTNGGTNPNSEVTQAGLSTATIAAEGNVNRQIFAVPGVNGSVGGDYVMAVYTLPALAFDTLGRGITITAQGSFGGNTNNKTIKIIFNPTTAVVGGTVGSGGNTIATTGVVTTNGSGWSLQANVFKYGALGANTQLGIHQAAQCAAVVQALTVPQNLTATESSAILIAVTGNCGTTVGDIALNFWEVNFMN
jgi:hypothetical protein